MRAARQLSLEFVRSHPADAASALERLPIEDASALLAEMPPSTAAAALRSMVSMSAAECLAQIPAQRAAAILDKLAPDVAAVVLLRLDPQQQERLLQEALPGTATSLRRRLRYREGTAGALVNSRVLSFPDQITAGQALARLRQASHRAQYYAYVVDRDERLVGVLTLRELMLAPGKEPLAAVMNPKVERLPAGADRAAILAHPGWLQFHALPVVDEAGRFLGTLDHETVKRLEKEAPFPTQSRHAVSFGLEFADLCWIGMTRVLGSVAAAVFRPPASPGTEKGAGHGG